MKVVWTQEALVRLAEIEEFIAKDSVGRARQFVDQLVERGELLADKPRIGRLVPEISRLDIREVIYKKYRIVYRLRNEVVEILTVFEGHRLLRMDEIAE